MRTNQPVQTRPEGRFASEGRTLYLLNSPILTAEGVYELRSISVEAARQLAAEGFVSAIGHEATAQALTALLGVVVPASRQAITMAPGDEAVVFRLRGRLPEGAVITSVAELEALGYDLLLLRRLE